MASHMNNSEIRVSAVKRPSRALIGNSIDAAIVVALLAAMLLSMYLPAIDHSIVRFGLAVVLFLFLPGYAAVAAVYPGKSPLGAIERTALSVGMSLVISPLIGFGLNFTTFGVRSLPMALSIAGFVLLFMAVALLRRRLMPPDERFVLDLATPVNSLWNALSLRNKIGMDRTATIMLITAALFVIITIGFLVAVPIKHEQYTEFYLYGKNGTIADYPVSCYLGDTKPVIVGIANHEGTVMTYNLAVTIDGIGSQRQEIYSDRFIIADNDTVEKTIDLTMDRAGDHLNLQFLLYVDGVPDTPYRACNLWVNVKAPPNATLPANVSVSPGPVA
jgi:uncharacterized membrane protein